MLQLTECIEKMITTLPSIYPLTIFSTYPVSKNPHNLNTIWLKIEENAHYPKLEIAIKV